MLSKLFLPIRFFLSEAFSSVFVKTFLFYQTFTRLILFFYALYKAQVEIFDFFQIFIFGFINDFITLIYILPIILILISFFNFILLKNNIKKIFASIFFILLNTVMIFNLAAEIFYWDEFGNKFDFIAVDYLIYTHEIRGTIKETIPLNFILFSIIFISCLIYFFKRKIINLAVELNSNIKNLAFSIIYLIFIVFFNKYYDSSIFTKNSNNFVKELAKNGPYEFVYAFFNNELDFKKYYPNLDSNIALDNFKTTLIQKNDKYLEKDSIKRYVTSNNDNIKPNIVVIVVESLSANFMKKFGNKEDLTPFLDSLSKKSLFFSNFYATGTRTVRGLEAVTLSIPPTAGSSILRRPNNENIFSVSTVFSQLGYDMDFVYGGYSYFDNMKYFYENNGFNVTDRNNFKTDEITHSNVWGIADENVFDKLLEIIDNKHKNKKPSFSLMVTTSNHRPFTFPEGKIDMPQKNRKSAVRYTDYSIEQFFKKASKKDWYDNTIFVIVADHCASCAGKTSLPIHSYHIPLFIYSPKYVKPLEISSIASQIDIAPTILGLMGQNYESSFFGYDLLKPHLNRAFISTYQLLGYIRYDEELKTKSLVILAPNKDPVVYNVDTNEHYQQIFDREDLVLEAISAYQTASEYFEKHKSFKK